MEIDHIFIFAGPDDGLLEKLTALGLVESFRRTHSGQGTANACFCFNNMYLEIIWVTDWRAMESLSLRKTRLSERARWRSNKANPFGLAWRDTADDSSSKSPAEIPTWDYRPSYLPTGLAIAVARGSDDLSQPFMFKPPGGSAPLSWPPERRGQLQDQMGLRDITEIVLTLPRSVGISPALRRLADNTILTVSLAEQDTASVVLKILRSGVRGHVNIALPEGELTK